MCGLELSDVLKLFIVIGLDCVVLVLEKRIFIHVIALFIFIEDGVVGGVHSVDDDYFVFTV